MSANEIPASEKALPIASWTEVVRNRRATQYFADTPVPDADLQQILTLGLQAPSAYNLQPWRFVVVRDAEQRQRLSAAAFGQPKVAEAPVILVACADTQAWREDSEAMAAIAIEHNQMTPEIAERVKGMIAAGMSAAPGPMGGYYPDLAVWGNRQTMVAFTTLMWTAEVMGYDTAPMEGFMEDQVRELLHLPESVRVCALLAIGHRKGEDRWFGGRFPLSRTVFGEEWGKEIKL